MVPYHYGIIWYGVYSKLTIKGVKLVRLLTYFPYSKDEAKALLEKEYGWKPYPQKHFESRFTKFFEGYWLPERFGYDPRRVQLSSLILAGQMTREEALKELETNAYDLETIKDEFKYIATKLGITIEELQRYFNMPLKFYWDYANSERVLRWFYRTAQKLHVGSTQVR